MELKTFIKEAKISIDRAASAMQLRNKCYIAEQPVLCGRATSAMW